MTIAKRENSVLKVLIVCMTVIVMIAGILILAPDAHADIASGTSGTCSWVIDDDGVLTISPTDGTSGTLASYTTGNGPFYSYRLKIKKVIVNPGVSTGEGCYSLFNGLQNCTETDLSGLNTSNATTMQAMFYQCSKLEALDLSSFDTSNVTGMVSMFSGCTNLTSLDLSPFDTSAVTSMSMMFQNCSSLKSLDLSSFDTSNVEFMVQMFNGCSSLTSLDLSSFNTSKVYQMNSMFRNCSSLTSLDLSSFDTSNLNSINSIFSNCSGLKQLNISSFNTSKISTPGRNVFENCSQLSEIQLGTMFSFKGNGTTSANNYAVLPTPPSGVTTGKWIREDGTFGPFTAEELRANYGDNAEAWAGTWVWEVPSTKYTLKFITPAGTVGELSNQKIEADQDGIISAAKLYLFNHRFDHWEDPNGNTYADGATIPANTYKAGDVITLTAVMVPLDNTVNIENGAFDVTLYGNEEVVFNDLPAGTAYQVWEETPDGWVLISQTNTSGVIEPLQISEAEFMNQYIPGTVTATFYGSKIMDGKAADSGTYAFELLENGEVIQTKNNGDGGFIAFDTITYDAAGEHTYTVREIIGSDDTIDYDHHAETIQVNITEDENGELHAEVTYDDDGIRFVNRTKPGILKIIKEAIGLTEANKDAEFTFNVVLQNENGTLVEGGQYYWYAEDIAG